MENVNADISDNANIADKEIKTKMNFLSFHPQ